MEELLEDIKNAQKIYSNPDLFIQQKNLKLFPIMKNASAKDLPWQLSMGSVFFIGKKSIIESYSWVDYNFSLSPQINIKRPIWINNITTHCVDPNEFNLEFYEWITKKETIVNYDKPSQLEEFAVSLVRAGMKIWVL